MAELESLNLKSAIHKLQLFLLEGIHHESQLFAAGPLISRSDYQDVVAERSIANTCGYPLCTNTLPSDRPRKGRYRISLKEHKVYDLHETYMYCSTPCIVNSRAFAESLEPERCDVSDSGTIDEVLRKFGEMSLGGEGGRGDLGFSNLKIEEKLDVGKGNMCLDDWIGPSNAIEGYVPLIDRSSLKTLKIPGNENKPKSARGKNGKGKLVEELDFTSTIIVGDQPGVPELSSVSKLKGYITKLEELEGDKFINLESHSIPIDNGRGLSSLAAEFQYGIPEMVYDSAENVSGRGAKESKKELLVGKTEQSNEAGFKSSLKSSGAKKLTRNVTWADKSKTGSRGNGKLCQVQEISDISNGAEPSRSSYEEEDDSIFLASAHACAHALSQAAEAVASGEADATDAVSEAGIVILSQCHEDGMRSQTDVGTMDGDTEEADLVPLKWPKKPGVLDSEIFNTEDSWYDPPPEGFSLSLSSFATMYMALFGWITSSSLAYIYGQDDHHEEFLFANGREYPQKIVLSDGRSSEIKLTLAGCLGRALPKVATDLRLKTPTFVIEKALDQLLNTMSFTDALPSFKLKQWHVIALLFIDALSVCRVPGVAPHMTSGRILLQKVLDGAQVSGEEYEILKDHLIPLGRVPHFYAQSGA